MGRKKIPDTEKKVKTGITINIDLNEMMEEYLEELGNINRSKYIEHLISEDLQKRGKLFKKEF